MRKSIAALLALTLLLPAGCAARPARGEGLQVVCSNFPYYDFVRTIGGDHVSPTLLIPAGRETHSFEPTPLDVITIAEADMVVYNGGQDEYWMEEVLQAAGENVGTVLPLLECAPLLEEEHTEGMEGHEGHDHDGHDHAVTYDEHIWTSPAVAIELCRAITEALCGADSAHAADYRANAKGYIAELSALDEAFHRAVAEGTRKTLIFGDRFPLLYFCEAYGLDYRAAFSGCASDTEPSLATLKYLIDKVGAEEIPVVYTIELSSQKVARAIAETTGAQVRTFHSCQNVTRQEFDGGETYLSLMTKNLDVLKEGLA